MAQQNLISFELPESNLTDILNALKVLQEKLLPYLKNLKPEDKKELSKMGDKTYAFVQKSLEYAVQNPELNPIFLDIEEYKKDMQAFELLRSLYNPLFQLSEALEDTMSLSGSDALAAALVFYTAIKGAAKANVAKSKTIYDDLSSRFPGRKPSKKD